jgi:hypothetical protein
MRITPAYTEAGSADVCRDCTLFVEIKRYKQMGGNFILSNSS